MSQKILSAEDLKQDQIDGMNAVLEFTESSASELLVEGPAGSGKTSMIRATIDQLPEDTRERTVICAPTNKAVKVARELSGGTVNTTTIYRLLGLSPQANGEVKEIQQHGSAEERLAGIDLVMLDEASMVSRALRPFIQDAVDRFGIKFVYICDRYQLPPVNEEQSWVFGTRNSVRLTEVKRHDNAILNLATSIREQIDAGCGKLKLLEDFDLENGGVELFARGKQFDGAILDRWQSNLEAGAETVSSARVLSWRNDRVRGYNDLVRELLYGRVEARENALLVGERVVVCNPVQSLSDDTVTLMHTDEEGVIQRIEVVEHPNYPEIECYRCIILRDATEDLAYVFTPTERGWKVANRMLGQLKQKAMKEDRVFWGAFWRLKELMNDVRPCHALTTHRSQGSTFREVFVDVDDIMANRERADAFRSLYVAVTRAQHKANLRWGGF